jgi:hypothetical protein
LIPPNNETLISGDGVESFNRVDDILLKYD